MPNLRYNRGAYLLGQGRVTAAAAFRLMLVSTSYTGNMDHNLVDDGTTSDPLSYEIGVGGYARGSLASVTLTEDDTNDFAYFDATDQTFSALATGATIGGAVMYVYSTSGGTTSDTGQELLALYDVTDTPTNGGDVVIQWAAPSAGGFLKLGTTS